MHPALLLYAVRQVGMYITLSVVLWGTSAAKISSAFFPCKVPRDHCVSSPATSLTVSSVGAAYMPPAHLFLDRQCNLPSPCRGRACPARSLMYSSTYLLQPFISTFPCNPRALKMPRTGIFPSGTQNGRHELFSPPMAHQASAFPENSNKKYPATSCEVSFWCTKMTQIRTYA